MQIYQQIKVKVNKYSSHIEILYSQFMLKARQNKGLLIFCYNKILTEK